MHRKAGLTNELKYETYHIFLLLFYKITFIFNKWVFLIIDYIFLQPYSSQVCSIFARTCTPIYHRQSGISSCSCQLFGKKLNLIMKATLKVSVHFIPNLQDIEELSVLEKDVIY